MSYTWPGNVRELEHHRARQRPCRIGYSRRAGSPERLREPLICNSSPRVDELSIKKTTRHIEEVLIARALEKTGGNRTAASKLLEISHRALLYKIKDYGLR